MSNTNLQHALNKSENRFLPQITLPLEQRLPSFKGRLRKTLCRYLGQRFQQNYWPFNARLKQLQPLAPWGTWLIMAGRGFGKTRLGAETILQWVREKRYKQIALIGATLDDVKNVMVEGVSGILSALPPDQEYTYRPGANLLKIGNTEIRFYSAERPRSLRGPQFDAMWIDELAKFRNLDQIWEQVKLSLRLGDEPRCLITTTPQPVPLLRALLLTPGTFITRGSTVENKPNLSAQFIQNVTEQYAHTKLGRQELSGELLDPFDESLFKPVYIRYKTIRLEVNYPLREGSFKSLFN